MKRILAKQRGANERQSATASQVYSDVYSNESQEQAFPLRGCAERMADRLRKA
jgi:hypothetical protein